MLKYLDMEKFILSDSKANYTIFPLILNLFLYVVVIKQQEILNLDLYLPHLSSDDL